MLVTPGSEGVNGDGSKILACIACIQVTGHECFKACTSKESCKDFKWTSTTC